MRIEFNSNGIGVYVSNDHPLPVTGDFNTTIEGLPASLGQKAKAASLAVTLSSDEDLLPLLGAVNETAPATDTASSGHSGRLQRIAQRLTSLIALFPASLGVKLTATSLSTTIATDDAMVGALTETAPGTDTASSGLNGRLQRIAQRITSLIGLLPAALGQGTMAQSMRVVLPSDQSALSIVGLYQAVGGTLTKSTKTTAYSSGQIIAQSATAGSCSGVAIAVGRANDATGMIRRLRLKTADTTWLNATIRVHLYKDAPTFTNGDAANWAGGTSESNYIGYSDIVLDRQFSDMVKGIGTPAVGSEWNFEPHASSQNIYYVLECRSTSAGGHTASATFTVVAETLQN